MFEVYLHGKFVREYSQRWQAEELANRIGGTIVRRPSN